MFRPRRADVPDQVGESLPVYSPYLVADMARVILPHEQRHHAGTHLMEQRKILAQLVPHGLGRQYF
ncbi:MAG: hypothetical protein M0039_05845, partial [Pseudomonadota bacterium]|nr:hypothetical protein [Pseudomonadota bacterium]